MSTVCAPPPGDPGAGPATLAAAWEQLKSFSTACPEGAFSFWDWYVLVGSTGGALWVVAYVFMVWQSHKDQRYGIPVTAVALNFAWEIIATVFLYNPIWLWAWFERAWVFIDMFIIGQAIYYGRKEQYNGTFAKYWHFIVPAYVLAAFVGQYTYIVQYRDHMGYQVAFLINLVMSASFILLLFSRLDHGLGTAGLSLPGAWLKFLGTLGTTVMCFYLLPIVDGPGPMVFMYFVWVGIFVLDVTYIVLLTRARRAERQGLPTAGVTA